MRLLKAMPKLFIEPRRRISLKLSNLKKLKKNS